MSSGTLRNELEHFPTKWIPVGRKKVLNANNLDRLSDPQGSDNDLGYSLLELLIVLAVLALATAVTIPEISGSRVTTARRGTERAVIEAVRQLRSEAIRTNRLQWMEVEPGGRSLRTNSGRRIGLPAGFTITPVQSTGPAPSRVRFYPDGRSSGSSWRVAGGGATTTLTIDWLTGRIQASASPP